MNFKLTLTLLLLSSANCSFAQNNAAPVEDRITQKPVIVQNQDKGEIIPPNCIGLGSSWANCKTVTVETTAVIPQSNLNVKSLDSMPNIETKSVEKIETKTQPTKDMVKLDSEEPIALAAYPENIKKYRDSSGVWNYTNDEATIKPGLKSEKVDLNNNPPKGLTKKVEKIESKKVSEVKTVKKQDMSKKSTKKVVKNTKREFKK